jgi:site-specific DNA-methyltransferase (adenine-specific)
LEAWVIQHDLRFGLNTDPLHGMETLPDKSVDHTITDPPYDEKTHKGRRAARRSDGGPELKDITFGSLRSHELVSAADGIARLTRRWALIFCAEEQIPDWKVAMRARDFTHVRTMPWVKPDAAPQMTGDRPGQGWEPILVFHAPYTGRMRWNGGGGKGVYTVNVNGEAGRFHQTQKPLALLEALVRDFTDYGERIMDPYAGSATTLVAAKKLGRLSIGWEADPDYYPKALNRIAGTAQQIELAPPAPMKQVRLFTS